MPTLLLWADNDPVMGPQLLRGTEQHVESLQIVMLANCSHWVQQDQAEEVNRQLACFFSDRNSPTECSGAAPPSRFGGAQQAEL